MFWLLLVLALWVPGGCRPGSGPVLSGGTKAGGVPPPAESASVPGDTLTASPPPAEDVAAPPPPGPEVAGEIADATVFGPEPPPRDREDPAARIHDAPPEDTLKNGEADLPTLMGPFLPEDLPADLPALPDTAGAPPVQPEPTSPRDAEDDPYQPDAPREWRPRVDPLRPASWDDGPIAEALAIPRTSPFGDSLDRVFLGATRPDSMTGPPGIPSGGVFSYIPSLIPTEDALAYRRAMRERAWPIIEAMEFFRPEWRDRRDQLAARTDSIDLHIAEVEEALGVKLPDPRWTRYGTRAPTSLQIEQDVETGAIEIVRLAQDAPASPPVAMDQAEFLSRLTSGQFWKVWKAESARGLKAAAVTGSRRGLVRLDIPIEVPSQLRSVFGEGRPNLSVRGSERITFSGTSRWRPKEKGNEMMRRQSKFPTLDMKQELNLQLTGTIGDKVSVDIDQSSQATTPLANRIRIRYKGYEDEIVQSVDLGNTSLTLPGTNYVTYGGRAEGLFGINTQARIGPVQLTGILTKQEGQSDSRSVTRSAETRTVKIDDLNYVANRYFFLRDPNGCPWELDQGTLDVFLDDYYAGNDVEMGAVPVVAWPPGKQYSDSLAYRRSFYRLVAGPPPNGDYQIQTSLYNGHPVLMLNRPLSDEYALAVAYSGWEMDRDLRPVPESFFTVGGGSRPSGLPGEADTLELALIRPSRSDSRIRESDLTIGPWADLRRFELRNVYDLGSRGILRDGFELRIRAKTTFGETQEPDRIGETTFLMMTGLDLSRETDVGRVPGRDDRVDSEFVSYELGLIQFPDLRPFDPDSSDLGYRLAQCSGYTFSRFGPGRPPGPGESPNFDNQRLRRPRALPTTTDSTQYRSPWVYDRINHVNPQADSRFYLEATFRSPVTMINLQAFGILPGSETVTASGRTLVRDRHYRIDYDLGEVEILEAANVTESDEISVNYSYMGFGGSQKTLGGIAAFYRPEDSNLSMSTSWLFESKGGVPGLEGDRPRLGQEPSRTIVGEVAGTYKTESRLLTRLTNAIPGVHARAPSRLNMGFGAGISLPNPNTKDRLYIDDFEGAKDVVSLSMSRRQWQPTSIPLPDYDTNNLPRGADDRAWRRGELWWYSPRRAARERDFRPTLSEREADHNRQIMQMQFFPRGESPEERKESWAGVVQVISTRGRDLSRAQFLDVWVNDFRQYRPQPTPDQERRGYLYIDLGAISEDAMWYREDPDSPLDPGDWFDLARPNGKLDTEDVVYPNGRLDVGGGVNEDTGLDNLLTGQPGAHYFDTYSFDESLADDDPRKYAHINGMEGNQELDTEDLNGNGVLDVLNSYFQIRIPLADSTLWETDVYRDYVHRDPGAPPGLVEPHNGWRRIRIPLGSDSLVTRLWDGDATEPVWERILHARVWVTGFEDRATLQLGGMEIVGNRWYENPISDLRGRPVDPADLAPGEEFYVGVINNKDDAAVYDPPFTVRKQDNIPEREQSITLNFSEFQPGRKASIYRTYGQDQDYTLYENMEFYLKGRYETGDADLICSMRLCRDAANDTLNYYEYRVPVTGHWRLLKIDFAALSQLQLEQPDSTTGLITRDLGDGVVISRRGNPSLTSVKRIALQVSNVGSRPLGRGSVWVNELRLTEVKRDVGLASRMTLSAELSDVARMDFNIQRTGADFLRIGQDRGSGTTSTTWNFSGSTNLSHFIRPLGIDAPVRTSVTSSRSVPKFRTNSDLVLDRATDRDIAESRSVDHSISLSRRQGQTWTDRYLLSPWSVSGGYRRAVTLNPTARDTSTTRRGSVGWNLNMANWGEWDVGSHWLFHPIGRLFGERTRMRLIPTSLSANLTGSHMMQTRYSRTDLSQPYVKQPSQDRNTAGLGLSASARPLSPITYRIDSGRDLMLRENQQSLLGLNLGRETSRKHQLSFSQEIPVLRSELAPRFSWSGNSDLVLARQATSSAEDEPDRANDLRNNRTTTYNARVSLSRLMEYLRDLSRLGGSEDSVGAAGRQAGGGQGRFSIGDINTTYSITSGTSFSLRKGEPGILYQLGLTDDPGRGVKALRQATEQRTRNRNLTLDTRLSLPDRVQITTRFSRAQGQSNSNGMVSTNRTLTWPDVDVNWGGLHEKLGLKRFFRTLQANSRYSRVTTEQGSSLRPKDSETVRTSLNPILSINATSPSGLQASLSSSANSSVTARFGTGASTTSSNDLSVGLTLRKSFNLTRQVTVPLTGRTQTIQSRLDANASLDWRSRRQEVTTGPRKVVSYDTSGWKLATGATYQFTQSINGSASIDVGQDTDNRNEAFTTRFIGVSISAQFTF